MCPACIANAAVAASVAVAGSASVGGLAALVLKFLRIGAKRER